MSPSTTAVLRSPLAKNLVAAGAAGTVTLLRPARFPKWLRRSMLLTNTAGTGTAMLLGSTATGADPVGSHAPLAGKLGSLAVPVGSTAGALAAVSGGLGLVTSGIGLRADAKVEQILIRRGVRRPRIWMAVGVVGVVLVVQVLQDRAARAAEEAAAKIAQQQAEAHRTPGTIPDPPRAGIR